MPLGRQKIAGLTQYAYNLNMKEFVMLRWFQKDGYWRTRCGRFAIEPSSTRTYFKLFDNNNRAAGSYSADTIKEAKQLAKRIVAK